MAAGASGNSVLARQLAGLTNANPFTFATAWAFPTSDAIHNFDAGFFGVDVTQGAMANCALQSVARISVTGGNAWAFNTLVVTKPGENMQSGLGAWSAEFDVNHYGVDSDTVWAGAQNVKGATSVSGGTKRPFLAFGVETGVGKAPFVYGLRFSGQDNAGTWEPAVWDSGADIETEPATLTHNVIETHYQGHPNPAFALEAGGKQSYGDGTQAPDLTTERGGPGIFKVTGTAVATGGIGVGNSAAAAAPGSVVKKMEVFDETGASLGYVPIYDTIT